MSYADIEADLEFLDAADDRLGYIIDLGKALAPLAANEKNDLTKVEGCASQVWLVPELRDGKVYFRGQSDAIIVSGLIAVLLAMVNGRDADEIAAMNIKGEFDRLRLGQHISGQRSNGLAAMAGRIQTLAKQVG